MKSLLMLAICIYPTFSFAIATQQETTAMQALETSVATSILIKEAPAGEAEDDSAANSSFKRTGALNRFATIQKMGVVSGSSLPALNRGNCVQLGSYSSSGCIAVTVASSSSSPRKGSSPQIESFSAQAAAIRVEEVKAADIQEDSRVSKSISLTK